MSTKIFRSLPRASTLNSLKPSQRTFITLPGTEPQSLSATRILPYNSSSLYTIIADVDSYSTFLPYCLASRVTKWSSPDAHARHWPAEADLTIGWGGYEETFTSRLFCVPGSIVEALGGEAVTTLSSSRIPHHAETLSSQKPEANNIFQKITTRWSVKPFHYKPSTGQPQTDKTAHPAREQTEVHLTLDFQFSNPVYAALSKAVAPRVAGIMIEAFEVRARRLLDGPAATVGGDDVRTERKKVEAL
jgi:coenzyme Q-binding protein COQ10